MACFAQNLKSGGKLKPEQAIMDIRQYTITLDVNPDQKTINGFAEIDLVLSQSTDVLLFDLVNLLKVDKAIVNGKEQKFTHENDLIRISSTVPAGKTKVRINYGGTPGESERAPWIGGFTWAKDSLGRPFVAITCQGEGAKIYFPCKDHPSDEPNEGATLNISVPKGLYAAGIPGPLVFPGPRQPIHAHTFVPSVQFLQISISLLSRRSVARKSLYFSLNQISSKEFLVRSPKTKCASLSKQQGTTFPSQVTTQLCHIFQQ